MKIDQAVLNILDQSTCEGDVLHLPPGQLDRQMYVAVNKVLEAAGGKWSRKLRGHVFAYPAAEVIDQISLTGEVIDKKKDLGQFFTPRPVADRVIELADLDDIEFKTVLEPSCGQGGLAWEIVKKTPLLKCYELDPKNVAEMQKHLVVDVTVADFLAVEPTPTFDRVIMNPPFAKQQDIKHINHALKFLKPGTGLLVSVMAAGVMFRENTMTKLFRALVEARGGFFETNPPKSFTQSGTDVNTVIVVIPAA